MRGLLLHRIVKSWNVQVLSWKSAIEWLVKLDFQLVQKSRPVICRCVRSDWANVCLNRCATLPLILSVDVRTPVDQNQYYKNDFFFPPQKYWAELLFSTGENRKCFLSILESALHHRNTLHFRMYYSRKQNCICIKCNIFKILLFLLDFSSNKCSLGDFF